MITYWYLCWQMESTQENIKVTRTARYFILGDRSLPVTAVIYVLHGYGMDAKSFLEQFAILLKPGILIVAPEGLSRFYRKGFSGDVVASWMTREDRLLEIDDYIHYLDKLHEFLFEGDKPKTYVVGFSQGTAAGSRWIANGKTKIAEFVAWCGEFASETDPDPAFFPLIRHVIALKDVFITPGQYENQTARVRSKGAHVKVYTFNGPHEIDTPTLQRVFNDAGI